MKIAVVTAFHSARPEWFAQCLASVGAQSIPCTHIVVSDGAGTPPLPADFNGQLIVLPRNHADYGDTPRGIGSAAAIGQGFDAVAYLDDDNWFHPLHLQSLALAHQRTGAALSSSARWLHARDGSPLLRCPDVDGVRLVDTSCYFLTAAAFPLCRWWQAMPKRFHPMGDRYLWGVAHQLRLRHAHTGQPSLHYRSHRRVCYELAGRVAPADALGDEDMAALLADLQRHFDCGEWRGTVPA